MSTPQLYRYESVSAIRSMASAPCVMERHGRIMQEHTGSTYRGSDWYGMDGGAPAVMQAMLTGFPSGEAKIAAMLEHMHGKLPRAVGIGRRLMRGMAGDELDIHAVNRGDISRAWSSRQRMVKRGVSALKIIVDIGGNSSSSHDVLQWRGIAGAALSEIMSKAGYSTEIVAAFGVQNYLDNNRGNPTVGIECVVKARGVSSDLGQLAATLCLTGFFRTVGFCAIVKSADDLGKRVDSSLGHHLNAEKIIPATAGVVNLYVPSTIYDEATAAEWIKSTVEMLQLVKGVK